MMPLLCLCYNRVYSSHNINAIRLLINLTTVLSAKRKQDIKGAVHAGVETVTFDRNAERALSRYLSSPAASLKS